MQIQRTKLALAAKASTPPQKPLAGEQAQEQAPPQETFQKSSPSHAPYTLGRAAAAVGGSIVEGAMQGAGTAFLREIAVMAGGPVAGGVTSLALMALGGYEGTRQYADKFAALTDSPVMGKVLGATMGAGKTAMYLMGPPGDYTASITTGMANGALFGLIEAPGKMAR